MDETRQLKWDKRFIGLAKYISDWSKDPSTKVGAVITNGVKLVSVGYNGLAQGVEDSLERLNDRDTKIRCIIHGERNAMIFAERSLVGCTLYTWPFMPCAACASMAINAGIKRCVALWSDNPRWKADFDLATAMFEEAKVELVLLEPNLCV